MTIGGHGLVESAGRSATVAVCVARQSCSEELSAVHERARVASGDDRAERRDWRGA